MDAVALMIWFAFGAVGAAIGQGMSGRPVAGLVWGALLGPIGWVIVFLAGDKRRKCRYCKSPLAKGAVKCPRCQTDFREPVRRPAQPQGAPGETRITY